MLGEFMYHNPTTLYFGSQSLENLDRELPLYGPNVLLVYGGGSIKKNGIYDAVFSYLKKNHKVVTEVPGVMPNPTAEKLREGAKAAKDSKADLILAVGGGSCCDFAKELPFPPMLMMIPGKSSMSVLKNRKGRPDRPCCLYTDHGGNRV